MTQKSHTPFKHLISKHLFSAASVSFLFLFAFVVGCADQGDPISPPPTDTTGNNGQFDWTDNIGPLMQNYCISCHGAVLQEGGFDARTYDVVLNYTTTAGNPLIDPGNAEESELYLRVIADGFPRMPQGGSLQDDQIAMIRTWINEGAP